jgi:hypothetical protein
MKKTLITLLSVFYLTAIVFAQKFSVKFPDSLLKQPFTGNILLYLSKDSKDPKSGTAGLDMFPCFRVFVKSIKPVYSVKKTAMVNQSGSSITRPERLIRQYSNIGKIMIFHYT